MTLARLAQGAVSTLSVSDGWAFWSSGIRSVSLERRPRGWVVEHALLDLREVSEMAFRQEEDAVAAFVSLLPPTVQARLRGLGNEGSTPSGGSKEEETE